MSFTHIAVGRMLVLATTVELVTFPILPELKISLILGTKGSLSS